jgi:hypothetical protein
LLKRGARRTFSDNTLSKSLPTSLYEKGGVTSPLEKGGSRGILKRGKSYLIK